MKLVAFHAAVVLLASCSAAVEARASGTLEARPGGGHSFSSGSSGSHSSGSSGGSSWHSSGSSGGSSWGSSGSSGSGSGWFGSSGGSSSSGTSGSGSYGSPYDNGELQRQLDESQCTLECINQQFGAGVQPDGGAFDQAACEQACRKRKDAARSSPSATTYYTPPPDPPVSRGLMPLTVMLGLIVTGAGVSYGLRRRKEHEWATWASTADEQELTAEAQQRYASIDAALTGVGSADKGFSRILFEDFLYALYAEVHTARGGGHLARLGPYLGDRARASLERWPAEAVDGIIVGSAMIGDVRVDPATRVVRVSVAFESNYTEQRDGGEQSYYAREQWVLERPADTQSRSPSIARVIGCASCGAPLDKIVGESCSHCGAPAAGVADWRVVDVVVEREARGPILTGTTEEQGTDLPTLVSPDVKERWAELCARDPEVSWASFGARVAVVFQTFHRTWAAQDLTDVRPLLSDMLFETQRYWIAAYKAQGLRNVTEDPAVVTMHLSKVTRDPHFDAVTLRLFATCKDYTLDRAGKVVGGSRDKERQYTEYWTFIRSAKKTGAPKTDTGCPSCGAPLGSIGMAGKCTSCGAKITTGDFDWILSRIEQDEVYAI